MGLPFHARAPALNQETMQVWGQDAEQSKAARRRAYIALPDISIFSVPVSLQVYGIILAFFQKASACRGSSKGRQKKRSKTTPG